MAQPRLNYIMAKDGVIPSIFARVDEQGNLHKAGIKIAGTVMIIVATIVPFTYLDDLISSGILIAFMMTDTSVIIVRMQQSSSDKPYMLEKFLIVFHSLSFLTGLLLRNWLSIGETGDTVRIMTITCCILLFYTGYRITRFKRNTNEPPGLFLTPFVPTLPLCGCFVSRIMHVDCFDMYSFSLDTSSVYPGEHLFDIPIRIGWIAGNHWVCGFSSVCIPL